MQREILGYPVVTIGGEEIPVKGSVMYEDGKELTINDWISVIHHWNNNIARIRKHLIPKMGSIYCRLCDLYLFDSCFLCPVRKKTGLPGCNGTPYKKLTEVIRERYAVQERDFLLSLAPKEYLPQLNFISNLAA